MKKINLSEAGVIVGGTAAPVCTVTFEKTSPTVCMEVNSCVDKNGNVVSSTSESADLVKCA